MNPLKSVKGTIITGFVLAIIATLVLGKGQLNIMEIEVWLHVLAGVVWIGLLYYFNFIQVPGVGAALAEAKDGGPGPAAINKYVAPNALLWFRWAAVVTFITGVGALENLSTATSGSGTVAAFTFAAGWEVIGFGAWLGTIMLFNVWVFIWPNQQKILGMKEASAEQIAKAKVVALMASRTNTVLSIPMLMSMTAFAHGLPY